MIARISGTVTDKLSGAAIIELNGLGYEVLVPQPLLSSLKTGEAASLYVYDHVREDVHLLFGFESLEARELFVRLTSVSGVGPKGALGIMSAGSVAHLKEAIASGDLGLLQGVSGIGKKTAQRIIIELKGKLELDDEAQEADPVYQALVGLGYPAAQAAATVRELPADVTGDQERIKAALRVLGK